MFSFSYYIWAQHREFKEWDQLDDVTKTFRAVRKPLPSILRLNRLSKFNDCDKNLKMIKFLIQFGSNIYNRTQSFIIMINLNDINRHVIYLIYIMLIVCWLDRKHSMSNAMIVIFEILSKKFIWHLFYVCELLSKIYLNSF